MKASANSIGLVLVGISAFTFASKTILAKLCYRYGADPITVLALRMAFAGVIFGGIMAYNVARGHWNLRLSRRQWFLAVILGVFGYYLSALLDFSGLLYVNASLGRMILFLYPTLVILINAALTRQPVRGGTWLSLAICYSGILLMLMPDLKEGGSNIWLGSALIFASALIYAVYLTAVERMLKSIDPMRFTSMVMCISCLAVLIHYLAVTGPHLDVQPQVVGYGFIMGTLSTVLPIYALTVGISKIGASKAAMVSMCGPVLTLLMGILLLDEKLTLVQIAGMLLVMAGVWRVGK